MFSFRNPRLDLEIDEDLDVILEQLRDFIVDNGLDPLRIPDIHYEFEFVSKIVCMYVYICRFVFICAITCNEIYTICRNSC